MIKHHRLVPFGYELDWTGEAICQNKANRHPYSNRPVPTQCFSLQRTKGYSNPETSQPRYWLKRAEGKGHYVGPSNLGFNF